MRTRSKTFSYYWYVGFLVLLAFFANAFFFEEISILCHTRFSLFFLLIEAVLRATRRIPYQVICLLHPLQFALASKLIYMHQLWQFKGLLSVHVYFTVFAPYFFRKYTIRIVKADIHVKMERIDLWQMLLSCTRDNFRCGLTTIYPYTAFLFYRVAQQLNRNSNCA